MVNMSIGEKIHTKKKDFEKSLINLKKAIDAYKGEPENILYQAALVQYFEISSELAWKLLRDILIREGVENINTPRMVLKEALKAGFIKNGDLWMQVIDDRNKSSHIYDEFLAQSIMRNISDEYEKLFEELKNFVENYTNGQE